MKKIIILFVFIVFVCKVSADVKLSISDGLDDDKLKGSIESTSSRLLSEINDAQTKGRTLQLSEFCANKTVQVSLTMLWENSPFYCTDNVIVERCITTTNGYQIRNIPLMMTPRSDRNFNENDYQEAVINFDKSGNIDGFYLSISMNLYMNVIKNNKEITDFRRRQLILDYVEKFRTSYNLKDIKFLQQVFSDDALIITGKVIKQKSVDNIALPDKIKYTKYSKKEYIDRLKVVFAANQYIKVTFDDIKVMRHPTDPNIYGVTLHQGYTSSSYHDEGYLFILWDFSDEDNPQILVRTWQPDNFNGRRLSEDEIFNINDFDI